MGRKKLDNPKKRHTFRLTAEAEAELAAKTNKSRYVSEAIIEKASNPLDAYKQALKQIDELTQTLKNLQI